MPVSIFTDSDHSGFGFLSVGEIGVIWFAAGQNNVICNCNH